MTTRNDFLRVVRAPTHLSRDEVANALVFFATLPDAVKVNADFDPNLFAPIGRPEAWPKPTKTTVLRVCRFVLTQYGLSVFTTLPPNTPRSALVARQNFVQWLRPINLGS